MYSFLPDEDIVYLEYSHDNIHVLYSLYTSFIYFILYFQYMVDRIHNNYALQVRYSL